MAERWRQRGAILPTMVIWSLASALTFGCAGTPRWVRGTDTSEFYYQGVGTSTTANQAERSALFGLCASIYGTDVEAVVEDFHREDEHGIQSDFSQWVSTYIAGKVPAEARVVARWEGQGQHWAYALVERPGQRHKIDLLYRKSMAGVERHAWVPGWAQFQKRQPRRAWTYMSGVGVGLLGGVTFAVLSNQAQTRLERAKTRIERDHYDDLANRRYWASNGFYALAGGMYVLNVLDGLTSRVAPYQIVADASARRMLLVVRF